MGVNSGSTFMALYWAYGATPLASSKAVMPSDQMSARKSYPPACSITC